MRLGDWRKKILHVPGLKHKENLDRKVSICRGQGRFAKQRVERT